MATAAVESGTRPSSTEPAADAASRSAMDFAYFSRDGKSTRVPRNAPNAGATVTIMR